MPLTLSKDDKINVSNHLHEIGCCKFCVLRFTGERCYKTYSEPGLSEGPCDGDVATENGNCEEPAEKRPKLEADGELQDVKESGDIADSEEKRQTCITCYSLLELGHLRRSFQEMVAAVKRSQCSFTKFTFQVSTPVTLDLRHHAMVLHLKSNFGEAYKEVLDSELLSVKEAWKYLVGGPFGTHFGAEFDTASSFQVSVTLPAPNAEAECGFLLQEYPSSFPNRKQRKHHSREVFTRHAVLDALHRMPDEEFKRLYGCPPKRPDPLPHETTVTCLHGPIYVAGRYCKYSRLLSQTPWILNGERIMESSVQEFITDVVDKHIPNSRIVFSSSGREDVDVRMLGRGRPFVLEIFEAKRTVYTSSEMEAIEKEINASTTDVKVSDLQLITKDATQILKEGEEHKRKTYYALCCANRSLTAEDVALVAGLRDVVLKQATPIRVLHRRNLAERERTIYEMSIEPLEDNKFHLRVTTQAGTYVKEFVHGDFGRTAPSLGELINAEVDIMELDVEVGNFQVLAVVKGDVVTGTLSQGVGL